MEKEGANNSIIVSSRKSVRCSKFGSSGLYVCALRMDEGWLVCACALRGTLVICLCVESEKRRQNG